MDSSDEEDVRNTVGNIPHWWYDTYKHFGYNLDGRKIIKPEKADQIDAFLKRMEDPEFWRTVEDKLSGQQVILTDDDMNIIKGLQKNRVPDLRYDPYEPWVNFFTNEVMKMPVTARLPQKAEFVSTIWERRKIGKMIHSIKLGRLKPYEPPQKKEPNFYSLWKETDAPLRRIQDYLPAPKLPLPGHAESYNPPEEYLFSPEELNVWRLHKDEPWKRKLSYIPEKFPNFRTIPYYSKFISERFERCMDLYLCPRTQKMRLTIEPEELVPRLPKPNELQPFPMNEGLQYHGHTHFVLTISVEPYGQFLASGSEDGTVRIWEVITARCIRVINIESKVTCVAWCPNLVISLLAVTAEHNCFLINPNVGNASVIKSTDQVVQQLYTDNNDIKKSDKNDYIFWKQASDSQWKNGFRILLQHNKTVNKVTWHVKGDYLATLMPEGQSHAVLIHQISKQLSQSPFNQCKGLVQYILFHPSRPLFFVAVSKNKHKNYATSISQTQKYVKVYNLAKQQLVKKLSAGTNYISSMAVHAGGDNIIVGTFDKKLVWFDLDLSIKPYQTLQHHKQAIRQVSFHKRYPLFASASDDGTIIICHGMVYSDLLQNPLIVPVKILRGHNVVNGIGIFDCCFHPTQPWLFSCGADKTIRLFT